MEVKTGYRTSEFGLTAVLNLLGVLLTSFGIIDPTDIDMVIRELSVIVGAIMTIVSSAVYVWSRVKVKEAAMQKSDAPLPSVKPSIENRVNVLG